MLKMSLWLPLLVVVLLHTAAAAPGTANTTQANICVLFDIIECRIKVECGCQEVQGRSKIQKLCF